MECNKDDAIKAREIAERKFKANDVAGAKKFALKAQNLDPGLEGIAQLLVTLDVYTASENMIAGESDWYDVLGVSPQADDDAVRKQYRKLALILHPDKNKSVGAEGAFMFVSQAWSLLSDKSRRAAYDARRDAVAKLPSAGTFKPSGANGLYNFPKTTMSDVKLNKNKNVHRTNGSSNFGSTSKSNPDTFWTICHRCKMQYEYLRTYLNQNLLCPRCRQPFFAVEQPPPDSKNSSKPSKKSHSHRDSRTKSNPKDEFQWVPFSGAAGVSSVAQAANVVQQTYEKVRRVREEAQASKNRDKVMKRKNYGSENIVGLSVEKKQRVGDFNGLSSSLVPSPKLHNILMHKTQKEISKQLNVHKPATSDMLKKTEKVNDQDKNMETTVANNDLRDVGLTKVKVVVPVPDSDFRGFDQYRTERDFEEGQVWAVYDDVDGMPRHYAMIHRIISRDPFRVRVSWLHSNTKIDCGFKKTIGDFRIGRRETYDGLNCFSHKVRWTKDSLGAISIFPRKGDVWAVYRNWSKDWDEFTDDDVQLKYDIVEVLDDYDEDLGVVVIPLVKVAGFKALFHRHLDPEQVRQIPKKEMYRFSHQAPSHLLSGTEGPNAPKGCRELDLATLPIEFLKVIDSAREDIEVNKAIIAEEEKTKKLHRIWNDH